MREIQCINLCDIFERADKTGIDISNYERIYIGSYFCGKYFQHINPEAIKLRLEKSGSKAPVTLVIPMSGQNDIERVKEATYKIVSTLCDYIDEITVNDYGMLEYICSTYKYPVNIGRLLMKDYRDPRYEDYYAQTIKPKIFTSFFDRLRENHNITGVEFDPTHQGIDLSKAPCDLNLAVHTPFCYITVGQTCEFASINKSVEYKFRPNSKCGKECTDYSVTYHADEGLQLYRVGRAIYFRNEDCKILSDREFRSIYFPIDKLEITGENPEVEDEYISTGK